MNLAEQLEQDEKYEEAYAEYKKQLTHNSNDIELLTKLAHVALILEKKEDAKIYYGKILELDPPNILAHEQLIDIFVHEDKFKYYLLRGNLHALQQQMSHAGSDYRKAIDNAKDVKEALPARYLYAGLCEGQEKYNEAINEYLKISDYDEENPLVFLKLAELYEKTEGLVSAIQTLERARQDRGIKEFDEILAGYYIRNSQPDKALELAKSDLTKARALFDLGKNEEGYKILMEIKDKFSKEKTFHSLLAQYYFQKKMFDEAFEAINEFAKIDPNSPLIYQMRALIYEEKGDSYNEHLNWGKYNIVRGQRDVALNEFLTAYRFNDTNVDLIESIAALLEIEGDKTKACEFYEKLSDVDKNNKLALEKLAEFRESIGDNYGALEYLERLKALDSRNEYVDKNYERVKNLVENGGGLMQFFKGIFGKRMG